MKIVKNHNQIPGLKGKYILRAYSKQEGDYVYAALSLMPIIYRLTFGLKHHTSF